MARHRPARLIVVGAFGGGGVFPRLSRDPFRSGGGDGWPLSAKPEHEDAWFDLGLVGGARRFVGH